ncbi:MAG: phosphatidylinositol kinase [Bdellovibrionales bacterium RIFOXYD1_FULL_53_11]|nr:MAG: phosphatidylinositol kinase [Bdellovibrionales bacterium RIFOXYD1_FULL_53_11]
MKKIKVYYCGWGEYWQLGTVADNGSQIIFEYDVNALRQGLELSPINLKLDSQAYGGFPDYQMRLPGIVADSLPDGWGLLLMDKIFRKHGIKPEEISPLDRLSFVGARGMGALGFEPEGFDDAKSQDMNMLEIVHEVQKIISGKAAATLPELAHMGGSPHGARPKVLVNYDRVQKNISTSHDGAGSPWLIKFQSARDHKEVCAAEALYAVLAKKSGLDVCQTEYFDLGKYSAFGTKRFDRIDDKRIPVHTLAGALHADFRIPSSVSYGSFLRVTRLMARDEREVYKAYRLSVFNVIFNNRDDHSKNISFLLDSKRNWKLAPSYDLTFCLGPGGEHQMDVCGEGRRVTFEHMMKLAHEGGLEKNKCRKIIDEVIGVANKFKKEAKKFPIRASTVSAIWKNISENIKIISPL